ncbi:MAG: alpha/beta hydrolase, partial [Terracidiphilus sp.]
ETQRGGQILVATNNILSRGLSPSAGAERSAGSIPAYPPSTTQSPRALRSIKLSGPAGQLEAVLNEGSANARFAALVCHPHPLGGGNLHNKVVYHAMKALNAPEWDLGCPVLRFNFRGTGLSKGTHHGEAETGDVMAGIDWLTREFQLPLIVAGFSFGAAMALRACGSCREQRDVRAVIALGLPTAASGHNYGYDFLKGLALPKLFLSGDRDAFGPADQLTEVIAAAAEPKRLIFISGADHFFTGHLEMMQRAFAGWLKEQLP